jgi:hypothetical protein
MSLHLIELKNRHNFVCNLFNSLISSIITGWLEILENEEYIVVLPSKEISTNFKDVYGFDFKIELQGNISNNITSTIFIPDILDLKKYNKIIRYMYDNIFDQTYCDIGGFIIKSNKSMLHLYASNTTIINPRKCKAVCNLIFIKHDNFKLNYLITQLDFIKYI